MEPDDRDDRDQEVSIGQDARRLLDDELLRAALTSLERVAVNDWKLSPPGTDGMQKREESHRMWLTVQDFTQSLTKLVVSGTLAAEQLESELKTETESQEFDSPNERRTGLHNS